MKTPYIFYPLIFLWLFIIMVDLVIVFDGFDRVRFNPRNRIEKKGEVK